MSDSASASSSAFGIVAVFILAVLKGVSWFLTEAFSLYFPNDSWCWIPFHVLIWDLCTLLLKYLFMSFAHFPIYFFFFLFSFSLLSFESSLCILNANLCWIYGLKIIFFIIKQNLKWTSKESNNEHLGLKNIQSGGTHLGLEFEVWVWIQTMPFISSETLGRYWISLWLSSSPVK